MYTKLHMMIINLSLEFLLLVYQKIIIYYNLIESQKSSSKPQINYVTVESMFNSFLYLTSLISSRITIR